MQSQTPPQYPTYVRLNFLKNPIQNYNLQDSPHSQTWDLPFESEYNNFIFKKQVAYERIFMVALRRN